MPELLTATSLTTTDIADQVRGLLEQKVQQALLAILHRTGEVEEIEQDPAREDVGTGQATARAPPSKPDREAVAAAALRAEILGSNRCTIAELARAFGVSERAIYLWIEKYRLKFVKVANVRYLSPHDVRRALEGEAKGASPPSPPRKPGRQPKGAPAAAAWVKQAETDIATLPTKRSSRPPGHPKRRTDKSLRAEAAAGTT
jgi:hypothetical protein